MLWHQTWGCCTQAGDAVDISIEGLECETFEDFRQQADRADGFLPGLPALLQLEPAPPSEEPTADAAPKQPQPAAQNQELPMGAVLQQASAFCSDRGFADGHDITAA